MWFFCYNTCLLLLVSHNCIQWFFMLCWWQSHLNWSKETHQEQSSTYEKLWPGSKWKIPQLLLWFKLIHCGQRYVSCSEVFCMQVMQNMPFQNSHWEFVTHTNTVHVEPFLNRKLNSPYFVLFLKNFALCASTNKTASMGPWQAKLFFIKTTLLNKTEFQSISL